MTKQIIDFTDTTLYVDRVQEFTSALYNPEIRFIFLKGWSWAGKSYLVAQVLLQELMDGARIWVFRKVSATLRASCLQLFKDIKSSRSIPSELFDIKESKEIRASNDWLCMMFGLDDEEKIKSIANFQRLRLEEATEFTFDDFQQLNLRLRGWTNHKIICSFNPVSAQSRIKTEIEDHPERRENAQRINKTARDNRFVDNLYLQSLQALEQTNPAKYRIYAQNLRWEWAKWIIFEEYKVFTTSIDPDVIGLDFGYNDPNALTYIKVVDSWEKKDLFIEEKIYINKQTALDLVQEMDRIWVPKNILIIADWARPEMIEDIRKAGYRITNVHKYSKSKNDQIDNAKQYNIHIKGHNLLKEISEFSRKLDKNQNSLDVPQDGNDHLIDSFLYWATHYKKSKVTALFI